MNKLKITIQSKKASPAPPISPILGQHGLNIITFCKEFNLKSTKYKDNLMLPVTIYFEKNKINRVVISLPSTTLFLKKNLFNYCSQNFISLRQIYEIARYISQHSKDRYFTKQLCKTIIGTCRSMKINIYNEKFQTKL